MSGSWVRLVVSSAGFASIASDPSEPSGPSTIGRWSCPSGPLMPPPSRSDGAARTSDRLHATVAADPVDALGDRRPEPDEVGRPSRDDLDVRQGGEQAGRCRRIAVDRDVGDADLHDRMRVRDGDAGQVGARARTRTRARCPCPRDGRCASRPSRRAPATCAIAASRRIDPRMRSNGCGIPTSPPCSRAAAMVSAADMPGGIARSRNRQMRSPSRVLTSSPTMTVSSGGARSRASSATSIRS